MEKVYESPVIEITVFSAAYKDACLATAETGVGFDGKWNDEDGFGD